MLPEDKVPNIMKNEISDNTITSVMSIVFAISAAVAVLIITLAALKLVMSKGNPQEVAKARETIIYASVGLVISLAAFTIVTFVIEGVS